MKVYLSTLLVAVSLFSVACGGGGSVKTTPPPPPATYTIGGTVSGLAGTGLVLQDNSGNNLPVSANASSFTFPTALASGAAYKVSVMTQPANPTQTCAVTKGSGTATGNVTSVSIACTTATYTVGGSISGLVGTGLVLQDNSSDTLPVTANATGFTFPTVVASTGAYKVSVMTQPSSPTQNCVVTGGSGTVNGDVTSVSVACTTMKYTVGGSISGLAGTGLVLENNSGDSLTLSAKATGFTFATSIDGGSGYKVSVFTQPTNPTQSCAVTGGSGTSNGNVTTVLVTCSNINQWTWVNGPVADDQSGIYGTQGIAASANVPGARYWGSSWTDADGNFWLFGGYSYDSIGTIADVNDLWKGSYNSTGQWMWTWVGGSKLGGAGGTYGTLGTADVANMPGARDSAATWTDSSGNVWIFGGHGYDSARTADNLNDLWKYSAGQWTWVSGSNVVNQKGTYGTQGTADPSNVPGARYSAMNWIDQQGNFWLFGGMGYDSTGTVGYLNDLWEGNYDSAGQWNWTWVNGSNLAGTKGIYGTQGISSPSNVPGSRYLSASWADAQGNLWLFGGYGSDSVGNIATLSDLWEFNVSSGEWTSVGGLATAGATGVYGALGVAEAANIPGSRKGAVGWKDSNGNSWLFGGIGFDSTGTAGELNDLWEYNASTGLWTWQSGSNLVGAAGSHGKLGVGASSNVPGARGGAPNWIDAAGNLWMFGGNGPISGVNGSFSDLWKYVP